MLETERCQEWALEHVLSYNRSCTSMHLSFYYQLSMKSGD